jgi:MFS family permease
MADNLRTDNRKLLSQIRTIDPRFWSLNVLQMLEKLAYWSVLIQLPIYTAQKGIEGGLNWEQWLKGLVFFIWAMVQNLVPFFFGIMSDKLGQKKIALISLILILAGYLTIGSTRDFFPFLFGIILIGIGSGLFKPSIQGSVAKTLNSGNSSAGWGIYFMLLNLAVIAAPPLSKYLKDLTWYAVFYGSAFIILLNLLISVSWKDVKPAEMKIDLLGSLRESMREFIKPSQYVLILCMSGFAIIYMQFYETLPNFIYDWSDTSSIARSIHLPDYMMMTTGLGRVISYEWLYNINSILVTLFVVFLAWATGFMNRIKAIILGISLASTGLLIAGFSMNGSLLILGFVVYTFGEMITNPKFTEQLSINSPEARKSMHLGFQNLSLAIGLGFGALLGGSLYGAFAEKSSLSLRYLTENGLFNASINHSVAFDFLSTKLNLSAYQTSELLWNTYNPWIVWMPFVAIAIISILGLIYYLRKKF